MATWYQTLPNSQYRLRLDVTSTANVALNTTSLSMAMYVEKLSGSGYWTSDTVYWSLRAPSGTTRNSGSRAGYDFRNYSLLHVGSASYTFAGSAPISVAAHWQDDSGSIGSGSITQTFTPAVIPVKPSGLTVTRVSDSQQVLDWSGSAVSSVVQRRVDGGDWFQVATPAAAVSWTDVTTSGNRKYEYRVANVAGAGQSDWSNTATVYTSPAPVGSVTAVRDGMDILVDVTGLPPYGTAFDVFDGAALVGSDVVAWPWLHVAPNPSLTHTYTVVSKRDSLVSVQSSPSNTVQLQAAPNAPSGLTPNGGLVASDEMVRLAWVHNPVDTSAQTVYELRHRPTGGAWTTVSGTTAEYRDVSLSASSTAYDWQVRTKGDHPDWSPWSAVATVTVVSRPGVAILAPSSGFDQPVLTVEWSYLQGQSLPQSGWRVELLDQSMTRLEYREGSGAAGSFLLTTRLAHDRVYTVRVWAATGAVWSAAASQTFTVAFVEPASAFVDGVWSEATGSVGLSVGDGRGPVIPDVVNLFPGITGDGTWAEVRRNLAPNPTATLSGAGWGSNNQPEEPATRGVPVPAPHPDGITTCVMQQSIGNRANLLNIHTVGGATPRSLTPGTPVSVYVWVSHEGYRTVGGSAWGAINPFPSQEWVRLDSVVNAAGDTPGLSISTITGLADPEHRAYATGAFIGDAGPYFDGSTTPATAQGVDQPEDFRWRWLGAPNASESVMESQNVTNVAGGYLTDGWPEYPDALRVAAGETASFPAAVGETVAIIARNDGQTINGVPLVAGLNHVPGAASMVLGAGDWVLPTRVADPAYVGPAFTGGEQITIGESVMQTGWTGEPYQSPVVASMVPAATSIDIERSVDGGIVWEPWLKSLDTILTNLTDWESLSNGVTLYRVTAWAASGAASTRVYEVHADSDAIWLSGGDKYSTTARLPFYGGIEVVPGRSKSLRQYLGATKPSVFGAPFTSKRLRMSGMTQDVPEHVLTASMSDLEVLAMLGAPVHMHRDPDGRRVYGAISEIPQPRLNGQGFWAYSYEMTETNH